MSFQGGRHSPSPGQNTCVEQGKVLHPRMSTFSRTRHGSLGTHSLLQRNSAPELRRSEGCGRRYPQCLICSVGFKSFSRAPTRELITLSEPSRPVCLREGQRPPEPEVNQVNGVTAGNIGLLPFLIPISGRRSCCTVGQLLAGLSPALSLWVQRWLHGPGVHHTAAPVQDPPA